MEVKILVYKDPETLKTMIERYASVYSYKLLGPVSVGVNPQGNTIFVATMTSETKTPE